MGSPNGSVMEKLGYKQDLERLPSGTFSPHGSALMMKKYINSKITELN